MKVRPYTPDDAAAWDAFCGRAAQATFLHRRRFLAYHGDRFRDRSVVVEDGRDWLAALPAAVQPDDPTTVCSHPGITYGGLLCAPSLYGGRLIDALAQIVDYYGTLGFRRVVYKAVPHIYHRVAMQDDLYALLRLGAARFRCDLTATIALEQRGAVSSRRRRGIKKAARAGVTIDEGPRHAAAIWCVLEERLRHRHGVKPVHTLDEIEQLRQWFPDEITFVSALLSGEVVGAVVLFDCGPVMHAQYITSSEAGNAAGALDLLFEYVIDRAESAGKRYFDFGNSNENQGRVLNQSLYQFKREFGAGGVVHEFYEVATTAQGGAVKCA
ncbi:MAG TPA: GNAT family N-acetyltransferase [Pirellulales bacterium]|jgi:hypothetical protein|nr:GNAT family N-acetyltransferase [Pirellulales bacterium]